MKGTADSDFGVAIENLETGGEIIIKAGFGDPPSPNDKTDVILEAPDYSALTANGVILRTCQGDGWGVKRTGRRFSENETEISERAREILERANKRQEEIARAESFRLN